MNRVAARLILIGLIALLAAPVASLGLGAAASPLPVALQTLPTDVLPSDLPTDILPTVDPTVVPTEVPTDVPSDVPTADPTGPVGGGTTETTSTVTIAYAKRQFSGAVSSQDFTCESDRTVVVKRVKSGRKTTVGKTETDEEGHWGLRKKHPKRGRYFAKVTKYGDCAGARSKAMRLPAK